MLNIISKRKIWFTFSGILVLISVVLLTLLEPNLGIDFTGGTAIEYRFSERPAAMALEETINAVSKS